VLLAACGFARRYGDLLERDDLIQEARLELVRTAARGAGGAAGAAAGG
jgi:hypothetical protein